MSIAVSRRQFMGGLAATIGTLGTSEAHPSAAPAASPAAQAARRVRMTLAEYDAAAKLSFNENPAGPSDAVMKAMASAHRFCSRYGDPDADTKNTMDTRKEHQALLAFLNSTTLVIFFVSFGVLCVLCAKRRRRVQRVLTRLRSRARQRRVRRPPAVRTLCSPDCAA